MPTRWHSPGLLVLLSALVPFGGAGAQNVSPAAPPAAPAAPPAEAASPAAAPAPAEAGRETGSGAGLSPRELQVLERIQKMKGSPWRTYGNCRYDWSGWRLSDGGVRVTKLECGDPPRRGGVAVHCGTLRITRLTPEGAWGVWRLPLSLEESSESGGEDLMVASLCANATPEKPAAAPAGSAPPAAAPKSGSPPAPGAPPPVKPKPSSPARPSG